MMSQDELLELARELRQRRRAVDEELMSGIEKDIAEYRAFLAEPRPAVPVPELLSRLPLMGWIIYEASYIEVENVQAAFESFTDDRRAASRAAFEAVVRIANAARTLPWPHFAPRALGAIRAQALAASKRDTTRGYDDAWAAHQDARKRYGSYRVDLTGTGFDGHILSLDETFLQLTLAETGTACRTAERVIGRWAEGVETSEWKGDDWSDEEADNARWTQRMFRELTDGAMFGRETLDLASNIAEEHGLVHTVDEHRLAQVTSFRNPGIMTARAILLLLSMSAEMERLRRPSLFDLRTWREVRWELVARFENAYRFIEKPVHDPDGEPVPLLPAHARSLVQLRLHLGLLVPGHVLPSNQSFAPCVARERLDDETVEELSRWLAEQVHGTRRGDANVIGSATKPSFIQSVEACRAEFGAPGGYREWRLRWLDLDRYAGEPGRAERVRRILAETPPGLPTEGV
ncbi:MULTISPECIES: hypothetical protein [Micromonospora]|nr:MULTISPECIES: hypothetical protein [unclassified Micromonospora]MBM0226912.1 hypothetical protein [Micromonospora sp. ATA51]